MENIFDSFPPITNQLLFNLLFKAFAVLSSFMYLVYAIVVLRQTQVMNQSLHTDRVTIYFFISLIQVLLAIFLVFLSFTII